MARAKGGEPTPLERKDAYLRRKYNLTLEQYQKMLHEQMYGCKICGRQPKPGKRPLNVDHDHKTGRVRGLLCFFCNHRLLGRGKESAYLHWAAFEYLSSDFDGRFL